MLAFTILSSEEQLNDFYVMATSFLKHHPDRLLYCKTDLKVKEIDGVVYLDRFANIDSYDENFAYFSPCVCFLASVENIFEMKINGTYHPNKTKEVKNDVYFYSKEHRTTAFDLNEDVMLNFSVPIRPGVGEVIQARQLSRFVPILNTRLYKPSVVQRNSYRTLSFPWERYYQAIVEAKEYIDPKFFDDVVKNCKLHPYMLYYTLTGLFDPWKENIS